MARCCDACISWSKICNEVMIWPSGVRQNMTADYIFNLECVQVKVFSPLGAGLAALGEAGIGS